MSVGAGEQVVFLQCSVRVLRSPREDFVWKDVQKAKSDLRGCFQAR